MSGQASVGARRRDPDAADVKKVGESGPVSATRLLKLRFSQNLQHYRRAAGISQEALALRAAVHRNIIGQLESAERLPNIETLLKLAAGLQILPALLLEGMLWPAVRSPQSVSQD